MVSYYSRGRTNRVGRSNRIKFFDHTLYCCNFPKQGKSQQKHSNLIKIIFFSCSKKQRFNQALILQKLQNFATGAVNTRFREIEIYCAVGNALENVLGNK